MRCQQKSADGFPDDLQTTIPPRLAEFDEAIDTRGRWDVESPLGEWTRVECICDGGRITNIVNGVTVNECYDVFPSAGRILLESEGFEILFRRFELRPLRRRS
ncbi:MAG: family 16 glycoside hydrolase [Vicinamibacteraceae bacterium]